MLLSPPPKKLLTLCFIHKGDRLLLGLKKRGFGAGYWNGFGGKVQPNETIEAAAMRELCEEAGLVGLEHRQRGILNFEFEGLPAELAGDPVVWQAHVFQVTEYTGEPAETEEMKPQWFALKDIPYSQMWADDPHWLPLFLAGKNFAGHFRFRNTTTLVSHKVKELI